MKDNDEYNTIEPYSKELAKIVQRAAMAGR